MTMSYVNQTAIAVKKEKGEEGKNRWQLNKTNKLNQLFPSLPFPSLLRVQATKAAEFKVGPRYVDSKYIGEGVSHITPEI